MVPRSIIESELPDGEFRTFCEMVLIQGAPKDDRDDNDWHSFGNQYIGDRIGKQADTIGRHGTGLDRRGLVGAERDGQGKIHYHVLHNPAWIDPQGRQTHVNPAVILEPPPVRSGATNKTRRAAGLPVPERTEEHRAKRNAKDRARRAIGTTMNGGHESPDMHPNERGGRTTMNGGDATVNGGDVSLSAGCLLNLNTGSEWVGHDAKSPGVSEFVPGDSPLGQVHGQEIYNDPDPREQVDTATGEIPDTLTDAEQVLADATRVVVTAEARRDLAKSRRTSKSTIGGVKRLRALANELGLDDHHLCLAIDLSLNPETATTIDTLNDLTSAQLGKVFLELKANAPIVLEPVPEAVDA